MAVSEKNVDKLIQKMHKYYNSKNHNTLATVDIPECLEYKSNEWLIYIFYSCLLDYGMRSKNYHNNLINTYNLYPQIFNPNYVVEKFITNKKKLLSIMKNNIHPRYPNVALDKWLNLSIELSKYDNLLDKIKEFKNFNELNLFIRGIKGFGQKTGGLLLRLIYESSICNFNDKLKYIPLDRHDIEISYLNNIIDSRKLNNNQIEELSSLYIKSGEKLGIDANLIDKYLWNIGNEFCNKKNCINCPLYNDCKTKEVQRNIIFSHESDIDGLGCVILGKLSFDNVDYVLMPNPEKLELSFRKYLEEKELDKYSRIYVTDLALYDPALTMVAESPLKDKVQVFDHHKRAIDDNMNRYKFTRIIEKDKSGKRCGTELFYEHLVQNNLINENKAITEFVELTRLEDTWEWKKFGAIGEKAHNLAILFNAIGIENYISRMTSKLLNNHKTFEFDEEEIVLIQNKKDEYNKILQSIMESAEYFFDENSNKFGIVFADYEYRNELAEYITINNNPEKIKYFIVVAMNKGEFGQKSYRSVEEGFDVNEIAVMHGGGGHQTAAMVNITKTQKLKASILPKKEGLKYLADSKYQSDIEEM